MTLDPTLVNQFEQQGYFVLPGFFSPAQIREFASIIDEHMRELERSKPEPGSRNLPGHGMLVGDFLAERDPRLLKFCSDPKIIEVITQFAGPDVRLYCNQAIYKPPEDPREFPWHQDNGYTPVKPDEYYTCWIALNDATVENGCIWVLPGTHRRGPLPHTASPLGKFAYDGPEKGLPVPVNAGGMVVFSSLLLHRSGPNTSRNVRKGYVVQYVPADAWHGATGAPFTDRLLVAAAGRPVDKFD
jgi:ectoine hydroxylase-related dioxygenase (phytanoyl-CoA dioxygenase family)